MAVAVLLDPAQSRERMVIGLHRHPVRDQHVVHPPPRRRRLHGVLIEPAVPVGIAGEHIAWLLTSPCTNTCFPLDETTKDVWPMLWPGVPTAVTPGATSAFQA